MQPRQPGQNIKSRDITLPTKAKHSQRLWFFQWSRMEVRVGLTKKTECGRIDAFELWCWKRLESPMDCKEIQPFNPQGNQS